MENELEKIKIDFTPIKANFYFSGKEIIVNKFIGLQDKMTLLTIYSESFTNTGEDFITRYTSAEYSLMLAIIDLCTNVDIAGIDVDNVICSEFWEKVKKEIINYSELRNDIDKIIANIENEKSVGITIDKLYYKLSSFIDQVSKVDVSEGGIAKLKNMFDEIKIVGDNLQTKVIESKVAEAPVEKKPRKPRQKKNEQS
jgi:hypothetical protein